MYFDDFSAYLRSGDTAHLREVFPQAEDLSIAAVYRNGFLRGCMEALRASYPVFEMMVGEDYFDSLAVQYVQKHPPRRATFIGYGDRFPAFVKQQQAQHQLAYLHDFACLDQAWMEAYFAGDSNLIHEADVQAWQQAGQDISAMRACLPRSARLLSLKHSISDLWLKLKSESVPEGEVQLQAIPQHLLIWRDQSDQINIRVTNEAEFSFLATLLGGSSLLQAATAAIEVQADFPVLDYFTELLNTDALATETVSNHRN